MGEFAKKQKESMVAKERYHHQPKSEVKMKKTQPGMHDDCLSGPINDDLQVKQPTRADRTETDEVCGIQPTGTHRTKNAWAENGEN